MKKIMFLVSSISRPRMFPVNMFSEKVRVILFLFQEILFRQQDKYGRTEHKGRRFNKE